MLEYTGAREARGGCHAGSRDLCPLDCEETGLRYDSSNYVSGRDNCSRSRGVRFVFFLLYLLVFLLSTFKKKKKAMLANTNWGANKLEEQWRSPHRSFHLKIRNVQLQAKVERGLNIRGIFSNIFNHLAGARKVCANELYLSAVLQGRNTIFK